MSSLPDEWPLPAGLELCRVETADSARGEAVRRARAGAEEGTLVWVERPLEPRGQHGEPWQLPEPPGLHAALILRPGLPAEECVQLGPAALVAIAAVVGAQVEPMTELHYRWPNDLLLNGGKAGAVWLDGEGADGVLDWLVITWALNTHAAPGSLGHDAAALAREGGAGAPDPAGLLQAIARELVRIVAVWDESGFDSILRSWRSRILTGHPFALRSSRGDQWQGAVAGVDETGALQLETDTGTTRLPLTAFFGLN